MRVKFRHTILCLVVAFALLPTLAFCQGIVKGTGLVSTDGPPAHSVNQNQDAEDARDTSSGYDYVYSRDGLGWILAGHRIQQFPFSVAPTDPPQDKKSHVVLNDIDSLYRWRSGAWHHINKGGSAITANNGITDNEAGGGIFRLGGRYMASPDAPFTMNRAVNIAGFLLAIGDVTDSTLFVVDGVNDRVGIGAASPARKLHVAGEVRITDLITDTPTRILGFDGDGDLGRLYLSGLVIDSGVLRAADSSATNEIQTYGHAGTSTYTNTLSGGGGSWSITGAGIAVISQTGGAVTVTATEVDGSITNEIQQIDTFSLSGTTLRLSLSSDGVPFKSVDLSGLLSGITASNGITRVVDDFQLGGTGTGNTTIAWSAFSWTNTWNTLSAGSGLILSSTSTAAASSTQKLLAVDLSGTNSNSNQETHSGHFSNTHGGTNPTNYAVYGTVDNGANSVAVVGVGANATGGVFGSSTSGTGVNGASSSSSGGFFSSTTGNAIIGQVNNSNTTPVSIYRGIGSNTNAVREISRYEAQTTGTAATGLGGRIDLRIEDAGGTVTHTNNLIWKWTDISAKTSQWIMTGLNSNVEADLFTLSGSGALRLNKYGIGIFTGTPAFDISVDASGNIIESAVSSLSGTGVANRFTLWTGTNTLSSDAAWTFDAANDRATFTGTVTGTGANTGILNLNSGALGAATTFLRMSGNVSSNMIAELVNANNATTAANSLFTISVGGAAAGDPVIQFNVAGALNYAVGIDNSDGDKFKITPNAALPGENGNDGITITNNTPPRLGVNISAPLHPLDVTGVARAGQFRQTANIWNNGDIVFGTGAGTGPTLNSISGGVNGFQVNFTTGTTPTADGVIFTATYPTPYGSLTYPVLWGRGNPGGVNFQNEHAKFNVDSAGAATLVIKNANGALTASTQYGFNIVVMGY